MSTANVFEDLLKRHDLPQLFQQIKERLDEESSRRDAFREWLDEDKKAEFINGEIILHSPVARKHLRVSEHLSTLLGVYIRLKKCGIIMVEKALIALSRNDYEPDLVFFSAEKAAAFEDDQMVFPAPDFIVEILSKSTARFGRGIKRIDYAAHGVQEYWIIDPSKKIIEQYLRAGNASEFMPPSRFQAGQMIQSTAIPGFQIPVEALFEDAACADALRQLL